MRSLHATEMEMFSLRGIDVEVATRLRARFIDGRFQFDYTRAGKLLFRKVRTPDKKFWIDPSGARLQFWNLDAITGLPNKPSEALVLTEGEIDCITIIQCCGGYAISVPNGATGQRTKHEIAISEDTRFSYLWDNEQLIHQIAQFDKIIIATDEDKPGMILRDELALRIGDTKCWYVNYPAGCKDANDVLLKYGPEAVRLLIDGAKPIRPGYLCRPSELPSQPKEIAYSTALPGLDKHFQIIRPEFIVVTGIPGHGKGQFIRVLAFHMAETHGWRSAFLTPEDPAWRVRRDMRRFALRNNRYANRDEQERAVAWIDQHFLISQPPEDDALTLDIVEHEMEVAALHHDCQMFVLDPWNEVDHRLERGETIDMYIEKSIRRTKRKARKLGMVLIVAAHPTKLSADTVPNLYSVSGSSNWKNKCDHGIIIHRDNYENGSARIIVEKSKDWETTGTPGEITLKFDRDKCDYGEL